MYQPVTLHEIVREAAHQLCHGECHQKMGQPAITYKIERAPTFLIANVI
jgi:hypothetical protein